MVSESLCKSPVMPSSFVSCKNNLSEFYELHKNEYKAVSYIASPNPNKVQNKRSAVIENVTMLLDVVVCIFVDS